MNFLTDFADQAVILPLAVAVAVLLAASSWWRGALAWVVGVGGTLALIGLGKILLAACGPMQLGDVLHSPSGHTASATIVYGGLLGLAWRRFRPTDLHASLAAAVIIAVLIGITRVVLRAHTWPEVVAGGLVGGAGVWVLLRLAGPAPDKLRPIRAVAVIVLVVALMHGTHLRAEGDIQEIGRRFGWLVPGCESPVGQARP